MKKYETVAFDLDGTLTEPSSGLVASFAYALDKMGIEYSSRESLKRFIGPPLLSEFVSVFGMSEEDAKKTIALFREYFSVYGWWDNYLYPGISEMLKELKSRGKKIILATSKPEVFAKKILEKFEIDVYFDFIGGASLDQTRVTKEAVLAFALNSVGASADKAVMIGDRKYDAQGARLLGVDSVGLLYGHGTREEIDNAGFTYVAESVSDILSIIL